MNSSESTFRAAATIELPPRYAFAGKLAGNSIRQLAQTKISVSLGAKRFNDRGRFLGRAVDHRGQQEIFVVPRIDNQYTQPDVFLVPSGDTSGGDWPTSADIARGRWLRPATIFPKGEDTAAARRRCDAVAASWRNQFTFRDEVRDGDTIVEAGLRPPQTGALHAVLAHWRVTEEPATVVMPTGTGKTETMLALFVRERLGKLLVVVPNRPLRDQTVDKFETLGLLKFLGVVGADALFPVVGLLEHKPRTPAEVDDFFDRCNVIVTTANIAGQCVPTVQERMAERCSHLFIDEAHHISAPTWASFRKAFLIRPIVQFTATPFRTDGKHVDGKVIFNYPLRKAQQEGYFKSIRFRPVDEFDQSMADREIAMEAVAQLDEDLAAGFDHVVMARAADTPRADRIFEIYAAEAALHNPVLLHSKLSEPDRREALRKLRSRQTRIIVCVDMLGEGFDLPQLKIAALHDIHKSLAITLQFTGRFTRTSTAGIGDATMIANIADDRVEESLRALYAENADWNVLLRTLSEGASGRHVKRTDFLSRFTEIPSEVALQSVEPKMSALFYRTRCRNWRPDRLPNALGEDRIYAGPALNPTDRTVLFITCDHEPVSWGHIRELSNTIWHLYLFHWNEEQQLLCINSSDHNGTHEGLAKAVCGDDVRLVRGENVFRSLHGINRLVLMNLGLNHTISRAIRFSMHMGSDIGPAMAEAEAQNKTKSNLFGIGYEDGARTTIGCSQKGRLWSYRVAYDMSDWLDWCHHVGAKLIDGTISTEAPFQNLIVPRPVDSRPPLVPLAIEWPAQLLDQREDLVQVEITDTRVPFYEVELTIIDHSADGPIRFRVQAGTRFAIYELQFSEEGVTYAPVGLEYAEVVVGRRSRSLSEWFRQDSPTVFFDDGSVLMYDHLYVPPAIGDRVPFSRDRLVAWDWTGIDLAVESQTPARLANSIQRRVITELLADGQTAWDIIIDDDGPHEAADVVALHLSDDRLLVHLYHCKYAGGAPGYRLSDLYEVCGQAQRSIRWRSGIPELIRHLLLRESKRVNDTGITRFERGDVTALRQLDRNARLLPVEMKISVVQPGLSRAAATTGQLDLLAVTELYLKETSAIDFAVIVSA